MRGEEIKKRDSSLRFFNEAAEPPEVSVAALAKRYQSIL
jgi:hypothetical protein